MSGLGLPDHLAAALRSSDHRFIVTGASGWIGSATLHMLKEALGPHSFKHRVYAFAGSKRTLRLTDGTEVPLLQLEALDELRAGPCLLFHYAFLGREKVASLSLEQYCAANARITDIVRRTIERIRPDGMFLTSSGAVYRPDRSIDTDIATNPYGVLKHRDEVIFADACAAAGTKLVTARVFNLSGEYINKLSSYALSSFILDALAGRPITIRATKRVERSYMHVGDLLSVAVNGLLIESRDRLLFETAGDRIIEIAELADLVRRVCERSDLDIIRSPLKALQHTDRYVGSADTMRCLTASRRFHPAGLNEQIGATRDYLAADFTS